MALGHVFRALHFLEPADRAFELEAAISGPVEVFGFGCRRDEELDLVLVERVDQRDEARGLVPHVGPHRRNADDDDRVIGLRDGEVVRRAARLPAQALEARSEEHTSELQSRENLVCRLLLEKKKTGITTISSRMSKLFT